MPGRSAAKFATWIASFLALYGFSLFACARYLPLSVGLPLAVLIFLAATGAVLYLTDMMLPGFNLFSEALCRLPSSDAVALTFDDGPVEPYTRQILDTLDRYGAKGTFFCLGRNVEAAPELAREIVRRGHAIGNHSFEHRILPRLSREGCRDELARGAEAIEKATGLKPHLVRCPKGYKSRKVAGVVAEMGGRLIGFSYPIFDVQNPPAPALVGRVLSRVRGGDVIVMHDGFALHAPGKRDSLVAALPEILEGLRAKGLRTVSLDRI